MNSFPYQRVVIVGVTGAGKSTLAETLARSFGLNLIEMDALYWEPDWVGAPDEVFRQRVEAAIRAPAWALAGNYSRVRDLTWPRAEAIIWLDYPLWVVFWRLIRRTFRRWWTRELLWGTNRENLWGHFKLWSDDSLIHWLFKTYARRKREIPFFLTQAQHVHLRLIRLYSPQETETWLQAINAH